MTDHRGLPGQPMKRARGWLLVVLLVVAVLGRLTAFVIAERAKHAAPTVAVSVLNRQSPCVRQQIAHQLSRGQQRPISARELARFQAQCPLAAARGTLSRRN